MPSNGYRESAYTLEHARNELVELRAMVTKIEETKLKEKGDRRGIARWQLGAALVFVAALVGPVGVGAIGQWSPWTTFGAGLSITCIFLALGLVIAAIVVLCGTEPTGRIGQ